MYGYNGFVLLVDLKKERCDTISLSQEILRKYIGGTGLAAWLLYQHCPEGIDPYHPDNPLIFCTSPLVGTQLTTSSKFAISRLWLPSPVINGSLLSLIYCIQFAIAVAYGPSGF